ncbi:F0F1 ATP synthase subunit B [Schleiferia thermophila]|jgi:F-type H+-transporting ATPase subunit b|uniref:ATP synthase subunit b n=1 Tax=Schleiferia thermophila TaxID=884107 RepID=A0A369A678_9FLAO|nr:F0F1 ATP synthase subunit B [Schleiferia thermophila]KFD39727.1 F0F1 ATP synthase subunit B [Schleiferia thermophila str. Yellowstone]RCX03918.1 ATP synthase F0 subcomplex B subunit [Schleiferia thermophila]GCD80151.1 ATP synthase subunit b [Schleiferia thermophila]
MELVTPGFGLFIWTLITFLLLVFILGKFAWKPILNSVKEREKNIEEALYAAEKARQEMQNLTNENEKLLKEARSERDAILKEARELKEKILSDAKEAAKIQGEKLLSEARKQIENEKMAAINELKNQVASLSIEIAEKILQKELEDSKKHEEFASSIINKVMIN